ncbi:LysE family translocator [Terrihabitans sp. B22-R8]|uniref:LysE family translocator n=1 Tax=Terrihabitans sp. B22-R8 TaxID=3425128 RepID=UPI00403C4A44
MLDWSLIGIGLGVGIAVAAPIGPINIMIIHRAIHRGFWPAFTAGLGATVGDAVYAGVAAFGINAISELVEGQRSLVQVLGGVLLIVLGLFLALHRVNPDGGLRNDTRLSWAGAAAAGFALAVANPATLFAIAAVFSGIDDLADDRLHAAAAITLTLAVAAGSLIWVLGLTTLISRYRHQIGRRWLRMINVASGLALAGCGVLLLGDIVLRL